MIWHTQNCNILTRISQVTKKCQKKEGVGFGKRSLKILLWPQRGIKKERDETESCTHPLDEGNEVANEENKSASAEAQWR